MDNASAQQAIEALMCLICGRKSSCGYMTRVFGRAQGVLLCLKTSINNNPVRISDDLKRSLANVNTMTKLGRGRHLPFHCLPCLTASKIQRSIRPRFAATFGFLKMSRELSGKWRHVQPRIYVPGAGGSAKTHVISDKCVRR